MRFVFDRIKMFVWIFLRIIRLGISVYNYMYSVLKQKTAGDAMRMVILRRSEVKGNFKVDHQDEGGRQEDVSRQVQRHSNGGHRAMQRCFKSESPNSD